MGPMWLGAEVTRGWGDSGAEVTGAEVGIRTPRPHYHLVTSAPSHLGPTTTSAPVWKKSLVRSAPSHLDP